MLTKYSRFGGERLTKGVEHLFDECKDCVVYDNITIGEVLDQIKESKVDFGKCTKGIKAEVAMRQAQIGYWDYVPIPRTSEMEKRENETLSPKI